MQACNVEKRVARDAILGRETSEAAKAFVSSNCPCDACYSKRRRFRLLGVTKGGHKIYGFCDGA